MEKSERFDAVEFDKESSGLQDEAKAMIVAIEEFIDKNFNEVEMQWQRERTLAKLEEVYMWIGKALKGKQNKRLPKVGIVKENGMISK